MDAAAVALEVGAAAPEFSARDGEGRLHRLEDYRGKTVVLYFYPRDNTSGCTAQACDFRDRHAAFARKGAVVLGVSPDSAKSHQGFSAKHKLPFSLLCDEDKALCKAYGVWQQKTLYGREFMGVVRSTFVIGPDGKLAAVERKVSVSGHVQSVLKAL